MGQHSFVRSDPNWSSFLAMLKAREHSDAPAAKAWRGTEYSFRDLSAASRSFAGFFRSEGCRPGDRVALISENSPQWVACFLGSRLAGLSCVPLDGQLGVEKVLALSRFVGASLIVGDPSWCAALSSGRCALPIACLTPGASVVSPLNEAPVAWEDLPPEDPSQTAAIIFTSGTTGDPKGVELTEANLLGNAQTLARLGIEREGDVMAVVLPLHHVYALTVGTLAPLLLGVPVVFPGTLEGTLLRQCLRECGVTILPAVPLLLERLAGAVRSGIERRAALQRLFLQSALRLSLWGRKLGVGLGRVLCAPVRRALAPSLKILVSAGASLSPEVNEFFLALGYTVVEGYGLTETSPAVAITPPDRPRPGSVGFPIPGAEVRLGPPGPDGSGEILVRGPMVMRGYFRRPDLTREAFTEGYFRTGDLGRFDRDGYLWITGRAKEVVVLPSGKNIYPEEVEAAYLKAPSVREICVLQHPERPEGLFAVVVPEEEVAWRDGEEIRSRIRFDLQEAARSLPAYQRLAGFALRAEPLPRTPLGKIRREEVRKLLGGMARPTLRGPSPAPEDDPLLLSEPSQRVLALLSELAGRPVEPHEHLELDLGLDSLKRLEAVSRLEADMGVAVSPERLLSVQRASDLMRLAAQSTGQGTAEPFSWKSVLGGEPSVPLKEVITVQGGVGTRLLRGLGWAFLRASIGVAFGLRSVGAENIPRGPCIIAPNHLSLIDAPVLFAALPRRVRAAACFVGARSQFQSAFRRFLVRPGRIILTDQIALSREALRLCAAALRKGLTVCIFPEGGRAPGPRCEPARPGIGLLARELQVPVLPTLIRGTEAVWSRWPDPPPRGRITVLFGPPIAPGVFQRISSHRNLGTPWDEALARLWAQYDSGRRQGAA